LHAQRSISDAAGFVLVDEAPVPSVRSVKVVSFHQPPFVQLSAQLMAQESFGKLKGFLLCQFRPFRFLRQAMGKVHDAPLRVDRYFPLLSLQRTEEAHLPINGRLLFPPEAIKRFPVGVLQQVGCFVIVFIHIGDQYGSDAVSLGGHSFPPQKIGGNSDGFLAVDFHQRHRVEVLVGKEA
jgi:hypothetical protein